MAAAVLPSGRSAGFQSLPIFITRSNSLIPAMTQYFSWASPVWAIPSIQSLLELLPPFVFAVPKKKVSHSRKAMRSSNKGLKDRTNIVNCPGCGSAKLAHHLCQRCYLTANRDWKAQQKSGVQDAGPS